MNPSRREQHSLKRARVSLGRQGIQDSHPQLTTLSRESDPRSTLRKTVSVPVANSVPSVVSALDELPMTSMINETFASFVNEGIQTVPPPPRSNIFFQGTGALSSVDTQRSYLSHSTLRRSTSGHDLSTLLPFPSRVSTTTTSSSTRSSSSVSDPSSARMQIAAMDSDSLLHNSCKLYPQTFCIVESALQLDPEAIRRRFPLVCEEFRDCASATETTERVGRQKYCYPINIALKHRADIEIIVSSDGTAKMRSALPQLTAVCLAQNRNFS